MIRTCLLYTSYVVYRFGNKEKVNLDDPSHIVAITRNPFYKLPYETGKTKYRYVVTSLDLSRIHIFAYYILATLLPVDKIIGKIYPLFAVALLFMAVGILLCFP